MKHCSICKMEMASGLVVHEDCAALARAILDMTEPDMAREMLRLQSELKYQKEQTKEWQKKCGLMHLELTAFRQKIEDGELIKLPCRYGDTVWLMDGKHVIATAVMLFSIDDKIGIVTTYDHTEHVLKKDVFTSRAEAEAALAKEAQQ